MDIIKRETNLGALYIDKNTAKMILEHNGNMITNIKSIMELFAEKRMPIKVQFEMTEECNFLCYYCYAKSLKKQKELTTENIKLMLDKLYDIGIIFLEFTGGEILTRKDFMEILDYTNKKGFVVSLFTNASMINEDIINNIKNVYTINTSLLAPTKERCDELTGKIGSFDQIINGINILKRSNINFFVQVTLTNENIDLYYKFKELENELNVRFVYNIDVGPSFSGFDLVKKYSLKDKDLNCIKELLDKNYINSMEEFIKCFQCGIGTSKFAIDSEGNILPCMKYRLKLGNIFENDFHEIWNSDTLKNIMDNELKRPDECNTCNKKEYCINCPGVYRLYGNSREKCRKAEIIFNMRNS